jgi:hypothetical protein
MAHRTPCCACQAGVCIAVFTVCIATGRQSRGPELGGDLSPRGLVTVYRVAPSMMSASVRFGRGSNALHFPS